MKKLLVSMIMLVSCLCVSAKGVYKITTCNVNLTEEGSASGKVIKTIPAGTVVCVKEDCQCEWIYVKWGENCGYVKASLLATIPSTLVEPDGKMSRYGRPAIALCEDGVVSFSKDKNKACSHHGGVKVWVNNDNQMQNLK